MISGVCQLHKFPTVIDLFLPLEKLSYCSFEQKEKKIDYHTRLREN